MARGYAAADTMCSSIAVPAQCAAVIPPPYATPSQHFAFDRDGITDRIVDGRRLSSFFIPVPRPRY